MIKASLLACAIIVGSLDLFAQISDFNDANFKKADSVAALYPDHSLVNLRVLSGKLTAPLERDEEKFRAIYKWVCDNIENDYSLFAEHKRQRERLDAKSFEIWNRRFSTEAFRILVKERRTVCTGYARLVSELAKYSGIECHVVDGYGRSVQSNLGGEGVVNHSWNAVRLNNKWYLCDPTWSSGVIDGPTRKFVKRFNELYFLPSPMMFAGNHYPLNTTFAFLDSISSLHDYLNKPLIYVESYRYDVKPRAPDRFRVTVEKGKPLLFRLEVKHGLDADLQLRIDDHSTDDRFISEGDDGYSVSHVFRSRGKFIATIAIESKPVISYEVIVK